MAKVKPAADDSEQKDDDIFVAPQYYQTAC